MHPITQENDTEAQTEKQLSTYLHAAEDEGIAIGHIASAAVADHRVARAELGAQRVLDAVLDLLLQQELAVRHAVTHL